MAKQNTELGALLTDAEAQHAASLTLLSQNRGGADQVKEDQIAELKKLASPPEPVQRVCGAVMLLLKRPQAWASARKAMGQNFSQ